MKVLLILVSAISLFCIGSYESQTGSDLVSTELEHVVDEDFDDFNLFGEGTCDRKIVTAMNRYSKRLEKEKGLEQKMHGLNQRKVHEPDDNAIDTISITYSIDRHMGYQEARALFYEIADGFIAHMNKEKHLLQYFYKPPIGYEHLDFRLSFDYSHVGYLKIGDVAYIQIEGNEISYSIVEKESPEQIEFIPTGDSEVFTLGNFCFNTRWVTRQLPETEQDIATEP